MTTVLASDDERERGSPVGDLDSPVTDTWARIRRVFDAVAELPPHARSAALDALCDGDHALRDEVTSLLAHDATAHDVIGGVVAGAARDAVSASVASLAATPSTLGRFHILGRLGAGGMGEVWLAEDPSLGRRVALKRPAMHLPLDARALAQLRQEARAAATITHPHVCVVHDVGEGPDGRPFIAMEYVEGETLAARLTRGALPMADVVEMGRQAAGALAAAHVRGVVHRDLKPSNMMLTTHGIKLLDFGIARVGDVGNTKGDGGAGTGLRGTVPYMSPEQVRGDTVDHRSDLFSLGVVLYEAATGCLPFRGANAAEVSAAILACRPVPPSRVRRELPLAFDQVIARLLAADREQRYQLASQVRQALSAPIAERRAAARGVRSPRGRTRTRRLAMVAALIAAAGVAIVGLGSAGALGVSPRVSGPAGPRLSTATTASVDAQQAYSLGIEQAERGRYAFAVSLLERAVQIDPEFATGWRSLARQRENAGLPHATVVEAATRAFELRARATPGEAFAIAVSYHQGVLGDLTAAIEEAERWRDASPGDPQPHHALADLFLSTGDFDRAVEAGRAAVRLSPDQASAYSNLAGALFALDRFDEARRVYRDAMARGLDAPEYHAFLWRIAFYTGDTVEMQRQVDWAIGSSTWASNMPSLIASLQGRWRDSQDVSTRTSAYFERAGTGGLVALAARYDAVNGALLGDCGTTKARAPRALGEGVPVEDQARALVALSLCGAASDRSAQVQDLAARHPRDTMLLHVWLPLVRAAAATSREQHAEAIDALRATSAYPGAGDSLPIYVRGLAHLQARSPAEAEAAFRTLIAHRGRTFWFPLYPLAHLGLARAITLRGDATAARDAYEAFFAAWPMADPDLPVMVAARRELARLRGEAAPPSP